MAPAPDDRLVIVTSEGVQLSLVVAGVGSRFLARLLDSLIQAGALIVLAIAQLGIDGSAFRVAFWAIVGFLVFFVYDAAFELGMQGRTPGKRAVGIRVIDDHGGPASGGAIIIRNLLRIIDFLPASYAIGLLTMVATRNSQRLGDLAAGTVVVRDFAGDRKLQVAETRGLQITVPDEQVRHWDVSAVTAREVEVVEQFLARRLSLPTEVRERFAADLANRLVEKVVGAPRDVHPEFVLEGVALAKRLRS